MPSQGSGLSYQVVEKIGSTLRPGISRIPPWPNARTSRTFPYSENPTPACPPARRRRSWRCFPNQRPGRKYWITLNCPEFSSLCPVTGQPDAARIVIRYVPGDMIVETKSLKFYLASFRNQPAFNEEIVNRILDDLVAALKPQELIVRGEFAPRGGIQLTTEATYPEPS